MPVLYISPFLLLASLSELCHGCRRPVHAVSSAKDDSDMLSFVRGVEELTGGVDEALIAVHSRLTISTVVRELLVCRQPNRHETSTALWYPYRRVSLRGQRAQIRLNQGVRDNPENDHSPFWFYRESIGTYMHGSHSNGGNAKTADGIVMYNQRC